MEHSREGTIEEIMITDDPEGNVDMNTNANGKVRQETRRPGKLRMGRREGGEGERNEEKETEEKGGGGDEGVKNSNSTKACSSSEVQTSPKTKDTCGTAGSQDEIINDSNVESNDSSHSGMRRVKNINMGEVPLCPVGLSLSGSGMQLYVKMDSFLHKKQLALLGNQFVAKICKAKAASGKMGQGKKSKRNRHSSATHRSQERPIADYNREFDQRGSTDPGIATGASPPKDVVLPAGSSNIVEEEVVDLTCLDSRLSTIKGPDSSRDVFNNQEVLGHEGERTHYWEKGIEDDQSSDLPHTKDSIAKQTATLKRHHKYRDECKPSRRFRTQSMYQKNDWGNRMEPSNEGLESIKNQDTQTSLALGEVMVRPKPVNVIPNFIGSQKRLMPPVFTSNDLPLKRPSIVRSCSSADNLIHQQRNNSSFFSPVQSIRAKRTDAYRPTNINNASTSVPPKPNNEANPLCRNTISEKDNLVIDKINESESSKYALLETTSPYPLPFSEPPMFLMPQLPSTYMDLLRT
ncbi:hypothetical protein ElyMa_000188600 [Elysia marginata]|uniref:Uncharacterized protein n=1 Tax=Elysia marginata TaxID=1093978 RepID=A0AAV4EUX6_9GAST|nr:hypothetical protein ElyMa_000188600 [Elysia marginata]